nr:PREDICTED: proline-rich protein 36-like [Rhinolophus sinicus]
MELSRTSVDDTRKPMGLGRCRHFFWLAVVFDTVGAIVMFTGVFADLLFCDLLLYLGAVIIFLSLLWWVVWYTGNIELTPEEAFKRSFHVPFAPMVDPASQTVSHRFSLRFCNVPRPFWWIRPGWCRRRLLQRNVSLSMTVSGQVEKQPATEDQGNDGMTSVKKSSDAEDLGREDLGPRPEAVQSAEGVCAPDPDSGPRCCEARLLRFVEQTSTHLLPPESTSPPLDQPLPPVNLTSVVPSAPTSQPLASLTSRNLPVVSSASKSQPPATLASTSLLAVPMSSAGQPLDTLASKSQATAMVVSQSHSLSVDAQSHLQVHVALESNLQNVSPASQTQSQPVQGSQAQILAKSPALIHLLSTPSFQTQSVGLRVASAAQDFQVLCDTQQAPQSSALVQEIALSQASPAQEILKKPVAQAFETVPPTGQELSQEVPGTMSPLPESPSPATEVQQSVSPESASTPTLEKSSHPL